MIINHPIDSILFELFPTVKTDSGIDTEKLEILLKDYYEYQGNKPTITITDESVEIIVDTDKIQKTDNDFRKAAALCEKGKVDEAKKALQKLIEIDPTNSESYRMLGQVYSDQGNPKEAINQLIDALCWDPHNKWALIMMGNTFARDKNDIEVAMKYYDQAMIVDPDNNIALNNIGATLLEKRKYQEAKKYFLKAEQIDKNYPNTQYALGMIAEEDGELLEAFELYSKTLKLCKPSHPVYNPAQQQLLSVVQDYLKSNIVGDILSEYRKSLEEKGGVKVEVIEDDTIPTVAKLEVAENYDRDHHLVKFKKNKVGYQHLVMHEMVHLDLIYQARDEDENELFTSNQEHKRAYIKSLEKDIVRLHKKGYPEDSLASLASDLFDGLNRQVFNTPIDLFIEDFLYKSFPKLRPYQFVSLLLINREGVDAVTNKKTVGLIPSTVLSISKIYNIINVMMLKDLFGIDMIPNLNAQKSELILANKFWDEFLEYREDREAGEEYELVQNWADDVGMNKYFELVNENEFRKKVNNPFAILDDIESDPYSLRPDPDKDKKMKQFKKAHEGKDVNMAVMMYMVDAIEKFTGISKTKLQEIAFEIAMLGTTGINPENQGYKVASLPNMTFSGYHLLAYYYVSWKLFNPVMHKKLELPFDQEYSLAQEFYSSTH
jgi:Tfp pilus assembly protein PilF